MAAIITEKFRQHNADQFFESFSEGSTSTYYLFVGKATAFTSGTTGGSDSSPPTPSDGPADTEFYAWDSMIIDQRIYLPQISLMQYQEETGPMEQFTICMMITYLHQTQQHQVHQTYMIHHFIL